MAYSFDINLYNEVNKEESKFSLDSRNVFLNIKKKEKGPYWPRLVKEEGKIHYIVVDWAYYVDEDEEDEEGKAPNRGNFQDFGGMGGMPGMGGMGGMPGMEGLMGMPGMGGMGMDGMPDDDSDDEKDGHKHSDNCGHAHNGKNYKYLNNIGGLNDLDTPVDVSK